MQRRRLHVECCPNHPVIRRKLIEVIHTAVDASTRACHGKGSANEIDLPAGMRGPVHPGVQVIVKGRLHE
eukprot:1165942-Alexandrium_andersonii.AAC.1